MKYILLFFVFGLISACGTIGTMHPLKYKKTIFSSKPNVFIIRGIIDSLEVYPLEGKMFRICIPVRNTEIKHARRADCVLVTPHGLPDLVLTYETRQWTDKRKKAP